MSIPCSAAGSSPTALVSEVRPPTQSHMGKRSRKPVCRACSSRALPSPRDRHGLRTEVQALGAEGGRGLEHAVARLRSAPGFRDHDGQGLAEGLPEPAENAVGAVGVGVVEEMGREAIPGPAQRIGHELRAESRAADSDDEQV